MRSKWSKIIRPEEDDLTIESFEMVELSPLAPGQEDQGTFSEEEDQEREPPHDCSFLQRQAYEAGRAAGIEEGKAQLRAECDAEWQRAMELVEQIGIARFKTIQQAEIDVVDLALAIAKKIIHREATIDKEIVVNQLRQALRWISTKNLVRVKVHPDHAERLEVCQSNMRNRDGHPLPLEIERDPLITRGGCVVAADTVFLDATVDEQLDVICRELKQGILKDDRGEPD